MKIQTRKKSGEISVTADNGKLLHIKSEHLITIDRTTGEIIIIGDDFVISE
jgi:hypothetical protein